MPDEVLAPVEASADPAPAPPVEAPAAKTTEAPATAESKTGPVKDIGQMARRRAKLSEQAKDIRERERRIAEQEKTWAQERQAHRTELEALKKQLDEVAKGNPLLREGANPEDTIREFLAKGTPEAKAYELERRLTEEREARTKLEARIEEEAKTRKAREEEGLRAAEQARESGALRAFAQAVSNADGSKRYPYLNAEYTPEEIHGQAAQLHEWAKSQKWRDAQGEWHTGASYTFDEVASHLEAKAKETYKTREDRRKAILAPPAEEPEVKAAPAKALPKKPTGTINIVAPSQKVVRRPMTREEEMESDLAMLRKASAQDAATRDKANGRA